VIPILIETDAPGNGLYGTKLKVQIGNLADTQTVPPTAPWIQDMDIEGPLPPTTTSEPEMLFFNHFQQLIPPTFQTWARKQVGGIPVIAVDIDPPGVDGLDDYPLYEERQTFDTTYADFYALAENRPQMALLTVSTVGVGPGSWPLSFTEVFDLGGSGLPGVPSVLLDDPAPTVDFLGTTLYIVPEPSTLVLLAMATLALPLCWWRRRKKA